MATYIAFDLVEAVAAVVGRCREVVAVETKCDSRNERMVQVLVDNLVCLGYVHRQSRGLGLDL